MFSDYGKLSQLKNTQAYFKNHFYKLLSELNSEEPEYTNLRNKFQDSAAQIERISQRQVKNQRKKTAKEDDVFDSRKKEAGQSEQKHRFSYFQEKLAKVELNHLPQITDSIYKEDRRIYGETQLEAYDRKKADPYFNGDGRLPHEGHKEESVDLFFYEKLNEINKSKFHDKCFRSLLGMGSEYNNPKRQLHKSFITHSEDFNDFESLLDLTYEVFGKAESKKFGKMFVPQLKKSLKKQEDVLFTEIMEYNIDRKKKILSGNYNLINQNILDQEDKEIELFLRRFFFQRKLFFKRKDWQFFDWIFDEILPFRELFPNPKIKRSILRIESVYREYKPKKKVFALSEQEIPSANKDDKKKTRRKGREDSPDRKDNKLFSKDEISSPTKSNKRRITFNKNFKSDYVEDEQPNDPEEAPVIQDPPEFEKIYMKRFQTSCLFEKSEYTFDETQPKGSLLKEYAIYPLQFVKSLGFARKLNLNQNVRNKINENVRDELKEMDGFVLFKQLNNLEKISTISKKDQHGGNIHVNFVSRDRLIKRQQAENSLFERMTSGFYRRINALGQNLEELL